MKGVRTTFTVRSRILRALLCGATRREAARAERVSATVAASVWYASRASCAPGFPLWVLEQARRQRVSEAELLRNYPTQRAEDLASVWAYVRAHREEIEQQTRENEES